MKKSNQRKVASVLSVAILLTGTFAWQSFSQMALNESSHYTQFDYEVGGRLHDHYNGENKDVFVENYADEDTGTWVYARIRLDEYYEHGTGAGTASGDTSEITVVRGDIPKATDDSIVPTFGDVDTWDTYAWGSIADSELVNQGETDEYEAFNIRTYRDLAFGKAGDAKVYMPTFNKHMYSLEADLNGTYAGTDGDRTTDFDRYRDYQVYAVGDKSEPTAVEYAEEGDQFTVYTEPASEHEAKETVRLTSDVVAMADWDGTAGAYWVYDTDGWAYWAQPILQQTATGALLDSVIVEAASEDHEEWYYAVNVICEIASAGNWGTELEEDGDGDVITNASGMYLWITEDAIELLDAISDGDVSGLNASTGDAGDN